MFRRTLRGSVSAVACAAAVALAMAGCKVDVPAAAGTDPAAGPGSDPGSRGPVRWSSSPARGSPPVYGLINGARRSIDVTMYEFADNHCGTRPGGGRQTRRTGSGDPGRAKIEY